MFFVYNSRFAKLWYRLSGMEAVTIFVWSFFVPPVEQVDPKYITHETEHQDQWLEYAFVGALLGWIIGAIVANAHHWPHTLTRQFHVALFAVVGCLVAFPIRYYAELVWRACRYKAHGYPVEGDATLGVIPITWSAAFLYAYDKHSLEQAARRRADQPER